MVSPADCKSAASGCRGSIPLLPTILISRELDKCHLGRFAGPAGEVAQRTELTSRQVAILRALEIAEPPRYVRVAAPPVAAAAVTG